MDPTTFQMMWQSSLFTTGMWKDVSGGTAFFTGNTGVVRAFGATLYKADESGRVSRSTDSGGTWTTLTLPIGNALWDIQHLEQVDSSTAFLSTGNNASPAGGEIYKTTDGGASWSKLTSHPAGEMPMSLTYDFLNNRVSFTTQNAINGNAGTIKAYYSNDLGVTWNTSAQQFSQTTLFGTGAKKTALDVTNNRIYVPQITASTSLPNAYNAIIYTDNGGLTWSVLTTSAPNFMNTLQFDNSNSTLIGAYYLSTNIYYTNNNGVSWNTLNPALGNINDTVISNGQYIIGTTSGVYRTTLPLTAGSVFTNISPVGFSGGVNSISVNTDGSGSLILGTQGNPGKVYITN
jgi:photosystem II stability/assembly factor-like uncharacterized protein